MPRLIHSTELTFPGPWLLEQPALDALDEFFRDQLETMEARYEAEFEERYRKTASSHEEINLLVTRIEYSPPRKLVYLKLTEKKGAEGATFAELASDLALESELPTGCRVSLEAKDIRCEVEVNDKGLRIAVSPESSEKAPALFVGLRRWGEQFQAPAWQRAWWSWGRGILFGCLFALSVPIALIMTPSGPSPEEKAHALLEEGITAEKVPQALEVLLMLGAHHVPLRGAQPAGIPRWFWPVFIGLVIVAIVAWIPPGVEIAIGRGKRRIERWRLWSRIAVFLLVSVPVFVVSSLVQSWLPEAIFGPKR